MSNRSTPQADRVEKSIAILRPDGTLLALPQSKTYSSNAVLPIYSITKTFLAAAVMGLSLIHI